MLSLEGLSLLEKNEAVAACFFDLFMGVSSRWIDFEVRREVASSQVLRIVIRSAFLELVTDATDATEVVSRPTARTPHPTRTGGQDDGSYTNSLKLVID